jgi:hypothetical protein
MSSMTVPNNTAVYLPITVSPMIPPSNGRKKATPTRRERKISQVMEGKRQHLQEEKEK